MKRRLISMIILTVALLALIFCLCACGKKDVPTESQKPVILENEGELEIEIPDDQDTFGE